MLRIELHPEGCVLPVKALPGARQNGLRGEHQGALRVGVTAAPEKGKANKALIDVLSKQLGLRKSQLELLSGDTAQQKRFLVRDLQPKELAALIEAALDAAD